MAVNDKCKLKFLELKAKRNYRFIVFRKRYSRRWWKRLGEPDESYEDFSACLPPNEYRFIVMHMNYC
ncbi:hypothetical protein GIB67_039631 [Kingdonia uniflora]|uniref:ADF-H domain-containing protein n=1 Tax=Kingdonia uniflora TaxID=39325 RepID=A0A7J7MDT1_9MAGN|nr:hypothetical protein GIB67_039631 [Kingdonia uniflora]